MVSCGLHALLLFGHVPARDRGGFPLDDPVPSTGVAVLRSRAKRSFQPRRNAMGSGYRYDLAAINTTLVHTSCVPFSVPARLRPVVPVPSSRTAIKAPRGLKRPGCS